MPPVVVASSRSASALETGAAKLWLLLIGVNHYLDFTLPSLRYAAVDCQGIGSALAAATQQFPQTELSIYHDLAAELPTLATVIASLHRIVTAAKPADTVAIYFSGHGVVEPSTQQTVLCLRDTDCHDLLNTGLPIRSLLQLLQDCAASDRLLWLDACHSGSISFAAASIDRQATILAASLQPIDSLRQGTDHSRGFYALLSCDEGQHSWEFPDLGHGVFSYYLMRGLRGEAADDRGVIDADGLYHYVYRQTVNYIETLNQQVRLSARQQRDRGEIGWFPEYSPQTPKRIVSGVGEIVLGLQPQTEIATTNHTALIIDLAADSNVEMFGRAIAQAGKFSLTQLSTDSASVAVVYERIQAFLSADCHDLESTRLVYLRGTIIAGDRNEAWLEIAPHLQIDRAWLRQEFSRNRHVRQTIVLDCLTSSTAQCAVDVAAEWALGLASTARCTDRHSQCILVGVAAPEEPELFAQVLLEATISSPVKICASVDRFLATVETNLSTVGIATYFWLDDPAPLLQAQRGITDEASAPIVDSLEFRSLPADRSDLTVVQNTTQLQDRIAPTYPTATFLYNLAAILRQLVGPVAPILLQQVDLAQNADPDLVIARLLPLLPERDRDTFLQQLKTLVEQPATAVAPIEATISPSLHPVQQSYFNAAMRLEIEQILRRIVGPIAGDLLSELAPTAWNTTQDLIDALALELKRESIAEFDRQLQHLLASSTRAMTHEPVADSPTGSMRGNELTPIDDNFKIACERELLNYIGPIAKFIVTTTYKAHPHASPTEFIAILASQIPDPDRAQAFRHKLDLP